MNANEKDEQTLDAILRNAHGEIEPLDSWGALRARIDQRVNSKESTSLATMRMAKDVVFWRRTALTMAACLAITAGVLIYMIGFSEDMGDSGQTNQVLLNQTQIEQLATTFSYVRQLFGQESPWLVVGSGGDADMGIEAGTTWARDTGKIIIVRLLINSQERDTTQRYFDVVTFPNQQASFQIPVANTSAINISLKPILRDDGKVEVEINARFNEGLPVNRITTLPNSVFTPLIRIQANGSWVNICASGQAVSNI